MVTMPVDPQARTAAVAPLSVYRTVNEAVARQAWQTEIQEYTIEGPGLLGFGLNLKAVLCSMGNWFVAEPDSSGNWQRVEDVREQAILHSFIGLNGEARAEMFRQQVFSDEAIGEQLLAVCPTNRGNRFEWIQLNQVGSEAQGETMITVRDSPETKTQKQQRKPGHDEHLRYLPKKHVTRVWSRSPWWPQLAHSPVRRALPSIRRLISAERRLERISDSRLLNNDILWLASEAASQYAAIDPNRRADFHKDFRQFAQRVYTATGGAAETAPFTLSTGSTWGPPQLIEMGGKITEEDLMAEEAAAKSIGRALDLPLRVFFETEDGGNHWSDWLVESQFVRMSAEPTALRSLNALTVAWLRPAYEFLQAEGFLDPKIDPDRRRIMIDMSGVLRNPDESKTLMEAYVTTGIPTRDTVAKRGLKLTDDEIMELPANLDEFEAWRQLHAQGNGADPGPDPYASGTAPTPKTAAVPPQVMAAAITAATRYDEDDEVVIRAEKIVRGEYLDHEAYARDSDLLALV